MAHGEIRPRSPSSRQVWVIALAAGIAAGLAAWLASGPAHRVFRPQLFRVDTMGMVSFEPSRLSQAEADIKNATLVYAILGGVTGLAMGVAGGLVGQSFGRAAKVGVAALAVGTLTGGGVARLLLPFFFRDVVPNLNDLMTPILLHGGIWMAIGAVGGAAFSMGAGARRSVAKATVAGCVGGLAAAVVYHLLGGLVFTGSTLTVPLSESAGVRLLAMTLPTVLLAIGATKATLDAVGGPPPASGS